MPSRRKIFSIDSTLERSSSTTRTVTASGDGTAPAASGKGAGAGPARDVNDDEDVLGKLGAFGPTWTRCHREDIVSKKRAVSEPPGAFGSPLGHDQAHAREPP